MYIDEITINSAKTFDRPYRFDFNFATPNIIPKVTFDLIHSNLHDVCGVVSFTEKYHLQCSNTTLEELNKMELVFHID